MEVDRHPGVRPRPSLWRELDLFSRRSFAFVSTALGMVALAAPLGLPGAAELLSGFGVVAVYFWSLFRPHAMPPAAVFVLGLFADLLGFGPLGVRALVLLLVHGFALRARRGLTGQRFLVVWLVFAAVVTVATGLEWGLDSLVFFRLLPPAAGAFEVALAVGLYPLVAVLLTRAHHGIAASERA